MTSQNVAFSRSRGALKIDAGRLDASVLALAEIGGLPNGGVTRLAYSEQEKQAREWVAAQYLECGLAVWLDAAGNLFARLPGLEQAPLVMTGSHLDTVPNGGRFDGAAGTLAALEVARTLSQVGVTPKLPIEFVVFAAEESPRFKVSNRFGSRALAGQVSSSDAYRMRDENGVTLAQAMRQLGLDPDALAMAQLASGAVRAFVELHIEQGTELQTLGVPVGVVSSITGTRRFQVEIQGRADHSGGTPMHARRDALAAAAELILDVEQAAKEIGGSLVETVTTLTLEPNAMNVIPGRVVLGVDIRDIHRDSIRQATDALKHSLQQVAEKRDVVTNLTLLRDTEPVEMSLRIREAITAAGKRAAISTAEVPSHTGHDTISLAELAEIGMIFVRNPSGRSHCPDEWVAGQDLAAGTQVLLETIWSLGESAHA